MLGVACCSGAATVILNQVDWTSVVFVTWFQKVGSLSNGFNNWQLALRSKNHQPLNDKHCNTGNTYISVNTVGGLRDVQRLW